MTSIVTLGASKNQKNKDKKTKKTPQKNKQQVATGKLSKKGHLQEILSHD